MKDSLSCTQCQHAAKLKVSSHAFAEQGPSSLPASDPAADAAVRSSRACQFPQEVNCTCTCIFVISTEQRLEKECMPYHAHRFLTWEFQLASG